MVWNVTQDDIRVRMAAVDEDVWPPPASEKPVPPDVSQRIPFSDYITDGRVVYEDVIKFYYNQANEMFGTDFKPPTK